MRLVPSWHARPPAPHDQGAGCPHPRLRPYKNPARTAAAPAAIIRYQDAMPLPSPEHAVLTRKRPLTVPCPTTGQARCDRLHAGMNQERVIPAGQGQKPQDMPLRRGQHHIAAGAPG